MIMALSALTARSIAASARQVNRHKRGVVFAISEGYTPNCYELVVRRFASAT